MFQSTLDTAARECLKEAIPAAFPQKNVPFLHPCHVHFLPSGAARPPLWAGAQAANGIKFFAAHRPRLQRVHPNAVSSVAGYNQSMKRLVGLISSVRDADEEAAPMDSRRSDGEDTGADAMLDQIKAAHSKRRQRAQASPNPHLPIGARRIRQVWLSSTCLMPAFFVSGRWHSGGVGE
eukprot:6205342-Pleurochrysis_carterae.AAC.3